MLREAKVGLLLLAAATVFAGSIFLIGEKGNVFSLKSRYFIKFERVGGLAEGNPVQLNGVNVGKVDHVVLPQKIEEELLTVWISIDRRYADRVREDSRARIKTLGLLGDKFIEISSGSADAAKIASEGRIEAAPTTDVDKLITSGEDVVANVAAISVSLRNVLARMEAGQGILGEMTADTETGQQAKKTVIETVASVREISRQIETGDGLLSTLINDRALAEAIFRIVARVEGILEQAETGEGTLSALLNDAEAGESFRRSMDNLRQMTDDMAALAKQIKQSEGILIKLLADEDYGKQTSKDLETLLHNLRLISDRLESGDGTLGKLIEDPEVHDAVNDIIVGVDESRMLRWLIRNRQKAGIEKRYEAATEEATPPQDSADSQSEKGSVATSQKEPTG